MQMRYRTQLKENSDEKGPIRVAQVAAFDDDLGPNAELVFSIPIAFNSLFSVNATTGVVTTTTRYGQTALCEVVCADLRVSVLIGVFLSLCISFCVHVQSALNQLIPWSNNHPAMHIHIRT